MCFGLKRCLCIRKCTMVRMDLLLDGATALLAREHGLRPEHFQGTHGRYMPFKVHSEGYATTAVQSYLSAKWRGDVVGPPAVLLEVIIPAESFEQYSLDGTLWVQHRYGTVALTRPLTEEIFKPCA